MNTNRRFFLKGLGAASIAAASLTGGITAFSAQAASTTGYKAIVCVFLLGGMDNYEVLLPYDTTSYDSYRSIRQSLMGRQGTSRNRESLLVLAPDDTSMLGGRQVALPPELGKLKGLFDSGEAAIIGNVGPLIEPLTRSGFESGAARVPPRLFSHNDQQATWQASAPEGAQFGWGGLFADAVLASGANSGAVDFTTISSEEVGPFLTGQVAKPYQIGVSGAANVNILAPLRENDVDPEQRAIYEKIQASLASSRFQGDHILHRDVANAFSGSFSANATYDQARGSIATLTTEFPASPLGGQLKAVAETISARNTLGVNRQIFYVGMGGFDTHSEQATNLPQLLAQIDSALSAFHTSMKTLGLAQDVTLFTASDFGRTLAVNGDGTDHGWGGHHFVLGGAVKGRQIYGQVPSMDLGHEADSGGGRLIPTTSVEQFAEPLGRWFGLSDTELRTALPNLTNFDPSTVNYMQQ